MRAARSRHFFRCHFKFAVFRWRYKSRRALYGARPLDPAWFEPYIEASSMAR